MFPVHALHAKGGDDAGWSFGTAGGDKCRLSSPKVTMFDGYQENTIQLHVTPTGLYLQSKAPIDASQADTGLQVEADSPEDRAQLRAAEADLKEFASFASLDIEALQTEIGLVEEGAQPQVVPGLHAQPDQCGAAGQRVGCGRA
jgi:hypothetical protein